ncbi:peptidase M55 [Marinitoga sp. 1135]|uniref:M55 family metallopeptidase n=1 Tax=unclassified Marinitoga TaxID=2640159 RepID=UPI001585DA44|nr:MULTISPECIES: M55 family metallopeptidase [unclassified Marinitoga]NUU96573.1 peptidase M55 [Marinitoga sp. 1135]NUU98504.1 peptidase M55 [Marinitoga sp. 1138]
MKIYISFDFEGLAGVNHWNDVSKGRDYKQNYAMIQLRAMLEELKEHEVVISDSHAMGDNILWSVTDEFPNVELISGGIRKYYMMAGLDSTFDRMIFFGYHAGVGTRYATMDHTYSSSSIHNVWINGVRVNETLINAAYGSLYNVPLAMVVGDDKLGEELKEHYNKLVYVSTKESLGRFSAKFKPMKKLIEEIKNATRKMLSMKKEDFELFKFESPVEMIVEFSDTLRADMVESMPLVERIDGRKVKLVSEDYSTIFEGLLAMTYITMAAKYI